MKGKKNDFSMSFYLNGKRVMFLGYVHDTRKACKWMESKRLRFDYFRLYERRTRKDLGKYEWSDLDARDPL